MSENCTHDCSTCSANCSSRQKSREEMFEQPNALSSVKHIIGVCSGKGGVGKSIVTSMLAVNMQRRGYKVGILDADITGPSIPKAFGLNAPVEGDGLGMIPPSTTTGIDIMSAMWAAICTIKDTRSWAEETMTTPSRGRDWNTVRGTSPVPGGQSTKR